MLGVSLWLTLPLQTEKQCSTYHTHILCIKADGLYYSCTNLTEYSLVSVAVDPLI